MKMSSESSISTEGKGDSLEEQEIGKSSILQKNRLLRQKFN